MTDSAPILRLRVLSGAHAGADTGLCVGISQIGSAPTADIFLSDWDGHALDIHVPAEGAPCLKSANPMEPHSPDVAISLGEPTMQGGIVFVIGALEDWPSDEILWRRWLQPVATPVVSSALPLKAPMVAVPAKWPIYAAVAATSLLCILGVLMSGRVAAGHPGVEIQWAGLRARIESLPDSKLTVEMTSPGIVKVSGWIRMSEGRERLSRILAAYGAVKVVQSFMVTQEVMQVLAQSAGETIYVKAVAIDVFEVTGQVSDLPKVRSRLHQALTDIGLREDRLRDSLLEKAGAAEALSDAAFMDRELRYRQLRDGSRLLQIGSSVSTNLP